MNNLALITGASSGLGREFAYIHAKYGGDMILVARRSEKLEEIKKDLEEKNKVQVHIISKDLISENACKEIYEDVKQIGDIDTLINNAGFGGIGKFYERDMQDDLNMIHLNVIALTKLTRLFLPDMIARNSGKILNVSSTASLMPGPNQAVYFATKAFVTSLSNALTSELHDTNITVTNLMPGATETEFGSKSGMDKTNLFSKTATAHDVANDGYKAMLEGKMNCISGVTFSQKILFKVLPFLPKKMVMKMVREGQEIK